MSDYLVFWMRNNALPLAEDLGTVVHGLMVARRDRLQDAAREEVSSEESETEMNALQPKVDLLVKLARFLTSVPPYSSGSAGLKEWADEPDPEVVEWLVRMAELEYVKIIDERKVEVITDSTPKRRVGDDERLRFEVVGKKVGYQLCATHHIDGSVATYAECASPQEALDRCIAEFQPTFPGGVSRFTEHHVKNIDTQETIYPGKHRLSPEAQTITKIAESGLPDLTHGLDDVFIDAGTVTPEQIKDYGILSLDDEEAPALGLD